MNDFFADLRMTLRASVVTALLLLSACGGTTTTTTTTAAPCIDPAATSATQRGSTSPALRLGHYSSGDGMVGFVLDRTGAVAKLRIDGSNEVVPLEAQPGFHKVTLVNRELHIGLEVDEYGGVVFSRKGERTNKEMFRDANASPL